mgnify:CR=1 FL=1
MIKDKSSLKSLIDHTVNELFDSRSNNEDDLIQFIHLFIYIELCIKL